MSDLPFETYPPFSAQSKCPKCESATINAVWRSGASWPLNETRPITPQGVRPVRFLQYMIRTCLFCGYSWREECLDTPPLLEKLRETLG